VGQDQDVYPRMHLGTKTCTKDDQLVAPCI